MAKQKQKKHEAAEATADSGKMGRKEFEKELAKLQIELTRLQTWVQAEGARVIVVFEGRDNGYPRCQMAQRQHCHEAERAGQYWGERGVR